MIGLEHRFVGASGVEVMALGPVASGLVIRGVWVCATAATSLFADLAFSICRALPLSLADVVAGRWVVNSSDSVNVSLGMPSLSFNLASGLAQQAVVPLYEYVSDGPVYLGIAAFSTAAFKLTSGLVVESGGGERVWTGVERRRASVRAAGSVMNELRAAGEAARV